MSKMDNSLIDPIALMLAVYCKNEIATRQILRIMANTETTREAKTVVSKLLNIMTPQAKEWVRELYETGFSEKF